MDADRGVARPVPRSRMTRGRTLTIGGIAIALAVRVTAGGCARAGETEVRSDLTLTEAKAETQALDSRDGWSSEVQAWETGGPTAVVSGPQGLSFVGNVDEDRHVTIASASRCVALSGDESPVSTY
jgi:hypothetical protein